MYEVHLEVVSLEFVIRKVFLIFHFVELILKIQLKTQSKAQICLTKNDFVKDLLGNLNSNTQKIFELNYFVEGKLYINTQKRYSYQGLVHMTRKEAKNLVFSNSKGNFCNEEVLILRITQLIISIAGSYELFYFIILRKLARIFFSQEIWTSGLIMFTCSENVKIYREFDLSYNYIEYLKEPTIIFCYQSNSNRLRLSSKSYNKKIHTRGNIIQKKTVDRSVYESCLIGNSTFVLIPTRV
jgi:hypothetical protein